MKLNLNKIIEDTSKEHWKANEPTVLEIHDYDELFGDVVDLLKINLKDEDTSILLYVVAHNVLKEDVDTDYPFEEGDDYYIIDDKNHVVWSCWDDQSEEIYDADPHKEYFKTSLDAVSTLFAEGLTVATVYDSQSNLIDLRSNPIDNPHFKFRFENGTLSYDVVKVYPNLILGMTKINISGRDVEVMVTRNAEGNVEIEPTQNGIFDEGGYLQNGHCTRGYNFDIILSKA